jgi:predicted transcriptional regulator
LNDELQELKQELKEDIQHLDKKVDKSEENTNKRLEKIEENMMQFTKIHNESMNKITQTFNDAMTKVSDAINDVKLAMVKDYVEKDDLKEVEISLTEKINDVNSKRKLDIKELRDDLTKSNNNNSINIPEIIKKLLSIGIISGATLFCEKIIHLFK